MKNIKKFLTTFILFIYVAIFLPLKAHASESLYFIHRDNLSSTGIVTNKTGQLVSQQVYYPYGSTRQTYTDPNQIPSGKLPTERQYTGQISDMAQTGLYYYNARYYNPQIGFFNQPDQLKPDLLNRYAYVGSNPINMIDPTGHLKLPGWVKDVWNANPLVKAGKAVTNFMRENHSLLAKEMATWNIPLVSDIAQINVQADEAAENFLFNVAPDPNVSFKDKFDAASNLVSFYGGELMVAGAVYESAKWAAGAGQFYSYNYGSQQKTVPGSGATTPIDRTTVPISAAATTPVDYEALYGPKIGSGSFGTVYGNPATGIATKIYANPNNPEIAWQADFLGKTGGRNGFPKLAGYVPGGYQMQLVENSQRIDDFIAAGGTLTQGEVDAAMGNLTSFYGSGMGIHGDLGQYGHFNNILVQALPGGGHSIWFIDPYIKNNTGDMTLEWNFILNKLQPLVGGP